MTTRLVTCLAPLGSNNVIKFYLHKNDVVVIALHSDFVCCDVEDTNTFSQDSNVIATKMVKMYLAPSL